MFGKNKVAQAAMEFLMTYGWALVMVIVVISALIYFGFLNPLNLMPSKCDTGLIWLKCNELKVDGTRNIAYVLLENKGDQDINVTRVNLTSKAGFACINNTGVILPQGIALMVETAVCSPPISSFLIGRKIKANLAVAWFRLDTDMPIVHLNVGNVLSSIEK